MGKLTGRWTDCVSGSQLASPSVDILLCKLCIRNAAVEPRDWVGHAAYDWYLRWQICFVRRWRGICTAHANDANTDNYNGLKWPPTHTRTRRAH